MKRNRVKSEHGKVEAKHAHQKAGGNNDQYDRHPAGNGVSGRRLLFQPLFAIYDLWFRKVIFRHIKSGTVITYGRANKCVRLILIPDGENGVEIV